MKAGQPKTIFITGTDTGVGKTVLTALLLSYLRETGARALAIKPFCSGGRADAELLHSLQHDDLTLDEINPFHFPEPLAPLVAARLHDRKITLRQTLRYLQQISGRLTNPPLHRSSAPPLHHSATPILLIEGAGGLLSPLGEDFDLLDLILATSSIPHPASGIQIVVIAPNRLGTINHTLLTIRALACKKLHKITVVLMDCVSPSSPRIPHHASHPASRSNPSILTELLPQIPLSCIPNLGKNPSKSGRIEQFAKKYKKTLAQILA